MEAAAIPPGECGQRKLHREQNVAPGPLGALNFRDIPFYHSRRLSSESQKLEWNGNVLYDTVWNCKNRYPYHNVYIVHLKKDTSCDQARPVFRPVHGVASRLILEVTNLWVGN